MICFSITDRLQGGWLGQGIAGGLTRETAPDIESGASVKRIGTFLCVR